MPTNVDTVRVADLPDASFVLDVREPEEWTAGHIEGAVHIPMNELPQHLRQQPDTLTAGTRVVVVCKVGGRSAAVTNWLRQQGVDAVNLEGGMLAWEHAGRPMQAENGRDPRVV